MATSQPLLLVSHQYQGPHLRPGVAAVPMQSLLLQQTLQILDSNLQDTRLIHQ